MGSSNGGEVAWIGIPAGSTGPEAEKKGSVEAAMLPGALRSSMASSDSTVRNESGRVGAGGTPNNSARVRAVQP